MKSFVSSILYASVIGGLGAALAGKAYRKHIQALAALLCAALIVSPLFKAFSGPELDALKPEAEISVDSGAAEELVLRQAAEDGAKALEKHIFSETGIKVRSIGISFESRDEGTFLSLVHAVTDTEEEARRVTALLEKELDGALIEVTSEG